MPLDDPGVARAPATWWRVALLVAVLAPFAVGMVAATRGEWHPHSDRAVIAARTADVFGGDLPLTGAYSRYAFSHPGPLENLLLAGPYELSGERPRSLLIGTLLVGAASAATAVVLGWRRGGLPGGVAVATAVLLIARAVGPTVLRDPWNPFFGLLPMALVVVAAWSVSCGSRWSLPVLVAAASVVVQGHVGTAVPVAAFGVWAVIAVVVARRRDPGWVAPALTAAGIGALLWLPPLVEQVTQTGNLGAIWSFFVGSEGVRPSTEQVVGIAGRELGAIGPWLTGSEPEFFGSVEPGWSGWPVVTAAALGAVLVARRRFVSTERPDPVSRFVATGLIGTVATVVALFGVRDDPYGYLFRWSWVTATFAWVAVVWGTASLVWRRAERPVPTWAAPAAVAVLLVTGLAVAVPAWGSDDPDRFASDALEALAPEVLATLEPDQTVTVVPAGDDIGRLAGGLAFELERRGHPVAVPNGDAHIWGNRRADRDEQAPEVARLVVVTGADAATLEYPELTLVASYDQLGPDERAELDAMRADVARRVEASGQDPTSLLPDLRAAGLTDAEIARLQELAGRAYEVGVYRA